MNILNNMILFLTSISVIASVVAIVVAIWAIVTHREKYYKEKKDIFDKQLNQVKNDLEKRKKANEKWFNKRFYIYG